MTLRGRHRDDYNCSADVMTLWADIGMTIVVVQM